MKTTTLIIAVLALACGGYAQDSKEGQNPKDVIQNLMRQAAGAKAAGNTEEAQKLQAKAEQIMAELRSREPGNKTEKFEGKDKPSPDKEQIKKPEGGEGKTKQFSDKESFKKPENAEAKTKQPSDKEPIKKSEVTEGKDKPSPDKEHFKKSDVAEGKGKPSPDKEHFKKSDNFEGKDKPFYGKGPEGKGPDAERLHHIMQAVEHLNAAGLHDPARSIAEVGEHMRREMEEQMKQRQAGEQGKDGKHQGEVADLQKKMQQMAEQIQQLQAELKKRG